MEGIGAAHAGQPTAKDRLADKRVFMVRSFDFHQDARITQAILRFPYVLFISDLLQGRIRSNALGAIHHEVKSESATIHPRCPSVTFIPYPPECHPERSEGSAVAFERLKLVSLPDSRRYAHDG